MLADGRGLPALRVRAGGVHGQPPVAAVVVQAGDSITWVYKDTTGCDQFGACIGHEVRFEDGTPGGDLKGFAAARSGETKITVPVPSSAVSGSVVRYFCNVNNHWQFGMTGLLRVAAASGSPSPSPTASPIAPPTPTTTVLAERVSARLPATGGSATGAGLLLVVCGLVTMLRVRSVATAGR